MSAALGRPPAAPGRPARTPSGRARRGGVLAVVSALLALLTVLALGRWLPPGAGAPPAPVGRPAAGPATEPPAPPDGTTTGVPAGTALAPYTGSMTVTEPRAVIDAQEIRGDLVIAAPEVVITRSRVLGTVSSDSRSASFTISDSEVVAGPRMVTAIGATNFVATRVHVTGGNRSVECRRDCLVEYSYVHGQAADPTGVTHESGIRMSQRGVIRYNTIACDAPDIPPDAGCSAALTGYGDFEPVRDNLVQGNHFVAGSGGFCTYGGSSGADGSKPFGDQASDIRFVDNVWERGSRPGEGGRPACGYWGPVTDFDPDRPGNLWSGNTWDDGEPLRP